MVETDLSRLLSDLSHTVETLNRESDTINDLIKRVEERLRQLNIGLEVWCSAPLVSTPVDVSTDEETYEEGSRDTELGWAKGVRGWELYLREQVYRKLSDDFGGQWRTLRTEDQRPLRQAPRQLRIAALKRFPQLLEELKEEAEEAVKAIEDAKRFADLC
jgi:hypothetical protein